MTSAPLWRTPVHDDSGWDALIMPESVVRIYP